MEIASPYSVLMAEEAVRITSRIDDLMTTIYQQADDSLAGVLKQTLKPAEYQMVVGEGTVERQSVQQKLDELKTGIMSLPLLTIRLAFYPSEQLQEDIMAWVKKKGPKQCRVQLVFDKSTVAGLVFEYNGQVYDYSLRHQLTELL